MKLGIFLLAGLKPVQVLVLGYNNAKTSSWCPTDAMTNK